VVRVHLDRVPGDIREGWPPCFIDRGSSERPCRARIGLPVDLPSVITWHARSAAGRWLQRRECLAGPGRRAGARFSEMQATEYGD
jgi:hypothetical protein